MVARIKGMLYCLTNPGMPGQVKIGRVEKDDIEVLYRRIRRLSAPTGVPSKYVLACAVSASDVKNKEKWMHDIFRDFGKSKEFFKVDPERVLSAMKLTGRKITYGKEFKAKIGLDAEKKSGQQKNERKPAFKFSMVDLDAGAKLTFSQDESIVAYVRPSNRVDFGGEIISLRKATKKAFEKIGEHKSSLRGPAHWKYKGEILSEMRERIESEE